MVVFIVYHIFTMMSRIINRNPAGNKLNFYREYAGNPYQNYI